MAERDRLAGELEQAKAAFADPAATIEELRGQATQLSSELDEARSQITALREENASIEGLKQRYRGSVPLKWVGGVIAVCLVAGILIGLWWVDYRSRKRHGGIRIY
jgi:FtsZ-binding cell division protein ZapB